MQCQHGTVHTLFARATRSAVVQPAWCKQLDVGWSGIAYESQDVHVTFLCPSLGGFWILDSGHRTRFWTENGTEIYMFSHILFLQYTKENQVLSFDSWSLHVQQYRECWTVEHVKLWLLKMILNDFYYLLSELQCISLNGDILTILTTLSLSNIQLQ